MDIATFQEQCLSTFSGNVEFPDQRRFLGDYSFAILEDNGTVTVKLDGQHIGNGRTVKEAVNAAYDARYYWAAKNGIRGTGESDPEDE